MNPQFYTYLLNLTKAIACEEDEEIQSLWSGYGAITRYRLKDAEYKTVVVKCISLQEVSEHPRGWNTDKSHARKVKSYEVETHWYEHYNQKTNAECRTPEFLGAYTEGQEQWIVLEDLDANYPLRKEEVDLIEVKACLGWLANFHARFLGSEPKGLWEVGTYWHLATRPDEWEQMGHAALKAKADSIDKILNDCIYQTIIHGDAKLANFCFSDGGDVAAVDFQYVGGGCGMKDVAYLVGSCMSGEGCEQYQSELLDYYFSVLSQNLEATIDAKALEAEWRKMYPIAVADFVRFLLGWMPTHQKVNAYSLGVMERVLVDLG
jgi:hypothetical protein